MPVFACRPSQQPIYLYGYSEPGQEIHLPTTPLFVSLVSVPAVVVGPFFVNQACRNPPMRSFAMIAILAGTSLGRGVDPPQDKPLSPEDALKRVNETVMVQMMVKASKNRLEKRGEIYLDS